MKKILTISLLGQVGNVFIVTVEHTDTVESFDSFAINFPALHQRKLEENLFAIVKIHLWWLKSIQIL